MLGVLETLADRQKDLKWREYILQSEVKRPLEKTTKKGADQLSALEVNWPGA